MTILRRALAGLGAVVLCALAMWFTSVKPHLVARLQTPLLAHGHVGAVVDNRVFSVKVDRMDVASGIVKHDSLRGDRRMTTPGIFVIVYVSAKSNLKPLQLGHARLETPGGLSYDETGRSDIFTSDASLEPMLWRSTFYVFEIPKDRLAGARFVVGQSDLVNNLSAETAVDLGLTASRTARLLTGPPTDYALKSS
ncbi:hypothetical protein GCM10023195_38690 [Actinoallomurus liliacearum]|uniref:DUF4352 domain-containing protein n=1 Tax=Actinoallomurus liliacearum TaxID=1080073 RepID=A0ABP8TJ43_9ACTN